MVEALAKIEILRNNAMRNDIYTTIRFNSNKHLLEPQNIMRK